ncbi:hypothetical protein [Macrococcus capreoli]|uniref:hypothetical protein n=1 Tax=Macrococcus capreoli TaxID=2982690 RepID=UPI003EE43E46
MKLNKPNDTNKAVEMTGNQTESKSDKKIILDGELESMEAFFIELEEISRKIKEDKKKIID